MADSFIQLSPDSTGKRVDTRTAPDGDHREVQVIGSPTTADVAEADATNGLDVDVTRVIPGTSASHLGKAVDSALGATDTGVASLAVRDDALAALTPADGDYTNLRTDSTGALWVRDTGGAAGGTAMVDDATFTPATTQGTPAFGFADETAPDSVDEGDAGALRMTLDRKLLTRVVGATDANRLDVDGSGHAQVDIAAASVTVPVSLAAGGTTQYAEDSAHSSGDLVTLAGVVQQTADAALSSDGDRSVLQVDATGFVKANVKSSALPAGASTLAEQQTQTTHLAAIAGDTTAIETAIQIMDDWDESDRAKVNPIAGQAGVAAGAGAVSALTQRVTLASDDPAVAALQILDNAIAGSEMQVDVVAALPAGNNNIGDVDIASIAAGDNNIGNVDIVTLPALAAGTNNIGDVDVLTMPVTEVVGDVAADAAVPANPLSIGGRASTAVPTAVSADGDSVYNWLNRLGMQVVSAIPGLGLNADPHTLLSETAQYTTTQTSAVLVAGGASERIVVTSVQIQVGGTTAGTLQVYFGTGAYARGTDEAIFDGEFAPSATLKPGIFMAPPGGFRAGALGDDILVTTSAAINPLTVTCWYYVLGV